MAKDETGDDGAEVMMGGPGSGRRPIGGDRESIRRLLVDVARHALDARERLRAAEVYLKYFPAEDAKAAEPVDLDAAIREAEDEVRKARNACEAVGIEPPQAVDPSPPRRRARSRAAGNGGRSPAPG